MRLRVMRQVHFSTAGNQTVDLVFFVNGLPVATAELEDRADSDIRGCDHPVQDLSTAERLRHGKVQPLFVSGARALVHFAVSEEQVWMTTKLAGTRHTSCRSTAPMRTAPGNPLNPSARVPRTCGACAATGCVAEHPRPADVRKHDKTTDPISGKTTKTSTCGSRVSTSGRR